MCFPEEKGKQYLSPKWVTKPTSYQSIGHACLSCTSLMTTSKCWKQPQFYVNLTEKRLLLEGSSKLMLTEFYSINSLTLSSKARTWAITPVTDIWKTVSCRGRRKRYQCLSKHSPTMSIQVWRCERESLSHLPCFGRMSSGEPSMMTKVGSQSGQFERCHSQYRIPTTWKAAGLNSGQERAILRSFEGTETLLDVRSCL